MALMAAASAMPLSSCGDHESERRIDAAARALSPLVGGSGLPGIVLATGDGRSEPIFRSLGHLDPAGGSKVMAPDSLFRLYCMSKAITGLAVMRQVAAGRVMIDQAVSDFLPAFETQKVVAAGGHLVDARRGLTIRDLLTHTGGLTVPMMSNSPIAPLYLAKGLLEPRLTVAALARKRGTPPASMDAFVEAIASMPLQFQPGGAYAYSLSYDVLGAVLEHISGRPLDVHLREAVLGPLGMDDTCFVVPKADLPRLTTEMARMASGAFVVNEPGADSVYAQRPSYLEGGNGLVSSARDFARLMDAVLSPGDAPDDLRGALRLLTRDILPSGIQFVDDGLVDGMATGGAVSRGELPLRVRPGTYYWSGWGGTYFWVDFASGYWMTIMVSLIQASSMKLKERVTDVVYGPHA